MISFRTRQKLNVALKNKDGIAVFIASRVMLREISKIPTVILMSFSQMIIADTLSEISPIDLACVARVPLGFSAHESSDARKLGRE